MAARDRTYAKIILPALQHRNEVAATDDLTEAMDKLDSHMTTQLIKAVATLSAINATKRTGKGGPAGAISRNTFISFPLARHTMSFQGWRQLGFSEYLCRAIQFGI